MAAGLSALGLELYGQAPGPAKMPMLAPVRVPDGVDDAAFRARLLDTHGVEIMGAFGPLAGRVWRVGTMAGNARPAAVTRTLTAIADVLGDLARRALPDALRAAGGRFDADARAATPA
jgi:aspartate aminotransferase-like enzyme